MQTSNNNTLSRQSLSNDELPRPNQQSRRRFLSAGITALAAQDSSVEAQTQHTSFPTTPIQPRSSAVSSEHSKLSPYQSRPEKPWNVQRVRHLLCRSGFGTTWQEIEQGLASTPAAIVDTMLAPEELETNVFYWADIEPFGPDEDKETTANLYGTWTRLMQLWWMTRMTNRASMLREKMVLFWHSHFVSEITKVEAPQLMFIQNQLFRELAFGSYKELAKRITIDPAMLIYLDGATNLAANPNENYARELLELFTLGSGTYTDGTSHYSEKDIIELARALTGWSVKGLKSKFDNIQFDSTSKTIFSETGNFGIGENADRDCIDLIFNQIDHDLHIQRAAVFICTKLYRYFVSDIVDMDVITDMATTLKGNDWNIQAVLRELLLSEHFFEEEFFGAQIKSPVEFVIGSLHEFGLQFMINPDPGDPQVHDPLTASTYLSQQILFPPNVKGWPGGRSWITMASLPMRARYTRLWVEPLQDSLPYDFQPVAFVNSFSDSDDVHAVLDHMLEILLPVPISNKRKDALLDILLGGAPAYEWKPELADNHIRTCLAAIGSFGEYQIY